tara:strand:+ start:737 stop:2353 length:1617 start_codon:yes stop_codon:yes gene_type:complete
VKENIILNLGSGGQLTTGKGADLTSGGEKKEEFESKFKSLLIKQSALNEGKNGKGLPSAGQDLAGLSQQQDTEKKINKTGRPIIVSGNPPTEAQVVAFASLQGIEPKGLEGLVRKDLMNQPKPSSVMVDKEDIRPQIDVEKTPPQTAVGTSFHYSNMPSSENELSIEVSQKDVLKTNQHMKPLPFKKGTNVSGSDEISEGKGSSFINENAVKPPNDVKPPNGLSKPNGKTVFAADKTLSISLKSAKLSLMPKSPIGSDPEEMINRAESMRQNVSLHMSKESGEPINIERDSFVTVGKKAQLERSLGQMIEKRHQNKIIPPTVTKMPPIDLTDALKNINIEGLGTLSVPERESRLDRQTDDVSTRLLVRDLSGLGDAGTMKLGKSFDRESTLIDIQRNPVDLEPLTKKMSEMLGQRLIAQIVKGAWRVEMELYPRSLGRVEIQLEMVNGHLEANFQTNQALTREILNEGISRLKDSLHEFGMESASVSVELENRHESDKKTTVSVIEEESDTMEIVDEDSPSKGKLEDINIDGRLDFFV